MRRRNLFLIACLTAGLMPLIPLGRKPARVEHPFPGWPTTYQGRPLTQLEMSPEEEGFRKSFPGRMAMFTDGRRMILMRWVARRTRKLHPAADCFRGSGWSVKSCGVTKGWLGQEWGCSVCRREGKTLQVYERIEDGSGQGWTDVSSWYWAALLNRTTGPWWAVTIVEEVRVERGSPFCKKGLPAPLRQELHDD